MHCTASLRIWVCTALEKSHPPAKPCPPGERGASPSPSTYCRCVVWRWGAAPHPGFEAFISRSQSVQAGLQGHQQGRCDWWTVNTNNWKPSRVWVNSLGLGTVKSVLELNVQLNFWRLVSPLKCYFKTILREGEGGKKLSWHYRQ